MTSQRKGEVAYALWKYRMGREGIRLNSDIKREFGNVSKATGIPQEEIVEFVKELTEELLKEALS
jgi:hypothetical protein